MRKLAISVAFLAMLLAGCGVDTATQGTQSEESTVDSTTRSTQPETTARTVAVPEKTAPPEKTVAPAEKTPAPAAATPAVRWVSAIGDSVMLGAVETLLQEVPDLALIDARGSRQASAAIDILRQRRDAGQLGDEVIVHIGNNGPFTAEQFDEMMQTLADIRKVLVVNVTGPPLLKAQNNTVLADGVQRYPNAVLVDWSSASANNPEFFAEDGLHLSLQGIQAYADLIAASLGSPEDSVGPPGPLETITSGEDGSFGKCVGLSSWCADTVTS
jgi:hypothetical protein